MKKTLMILLLSGYFSVLSDGMLGPIYGIYVEKIGGDFLEVGISWALYTISLGALTILIGKFEDRIRDLKGILVFSYWIIAFLTLGYLLVKNPMELFILQLLMGISTAFLDPAFDELYTLYIEKGKESSEWAMWEGLRNIAIGIGAILAGVILQFLNFFWFFVVLYFVQVIAAAIATTLLISKNIRKKTL